MLICPDCRHSLCQEHSCVNCGLNFNHLHPIKVFLSKNEQSSAVHAHYNENYSQIALDDLKESIVDERHINTQADKLFSYLPCVKNKVVCEIGIGHGKLLKRISNMKPKKLVGIDIAPEYLKWLIENETFSFEPVLANAESLPYSEEFDLVISTDVMEHVLNVGNYLISIRQSLKPNGTFVVRVPYLEDYTAYSKYMGCKYDFVHLRNFSRETLKIVLQGAGFDIKRFHYDGYISYNLRFGMEPRRRQFFAWAISKFVRGFYGDFPHTANIPNWLGRLFIKPTCITAICSKQ